MSETMLRYTRWVGKITLDLTMATYSDFDKAWQNWKTVDSSEHHFGQFLHSRGHVHAADLAVHGENIPEALHVRRRVLMLLGPHYRVIIKAYLAKLP